MRALIERLKQWLTDHAEQRRRQEALARVRAADQQHEHIRDRVLVLALLAVLLATGIGANVVGIAAWAGGL